MKLSVCKLIMSCVEICSPNREIKLLHFQQRYSWDCGLSCVIMVLPIDKRIQFLDNYKKICQEAGFNKSTWTIDLCYLLKRFSVGHIYYTITLGVNPDFNNENFYRKILNKDEERVLKLFESAKDNGLNVQKLSLNMNDLITHLKNHGPIIVLVNANNLTCDNCSLFRLSKHFRACLPSPVPYHGHYIVICGYSLVEKTVFYRNPTFRDRVCKTSFSELSKARKSYGTDEDIIFVFPGSKSN